MICGPQLSRLGSEPHGGPLMTAAVGLHRRPSERIGGNVPATASSRRRAYLTSPSGTSLSPDLRPATTGEAGISPCNLNPSEGFKKLTSVWFRDGGNDVVPVPLLEFRTAQRRERKLIVVLDLDECLIHSTDFRGSNLAAVERERKGRTDRELDATLAGLAKDDTETFELEFDDGASCTVRKRPGLDRFLKACAAEFDVFAFTAGSREYAAPLLDLLDPAARLFKGRLYREHCREVTDAECGVGFVKDLTALKDLGAIAGPEELKRCVLVDNDPTSFICQPSNGIQVPSFLGQPDAVLDSVLELLRQLASLQDVRPALAMRATVLSEENQHEAFSP